MIIRASVLGVGTLVVAAFAGWQRAGTVVGTVRDEHSGAPLTAVALHAPDAGGGSGSLAWTDSEGHYRLTGLAAGLQTVDALHGFYFPEHRMLRVHSGAVDTLDFRLRADPECCDREPAR
jgi:carboxypeptidase family protein